MFARFAVLLLGAVGASGASAQGTGLYARGGEGLRVPAVTASTFGGFRLPQYLGLETGYALAPRGGLSAGGLRDAAMPDAGGRVAGWSTFAVGRYPAGRSFDLFAKAGVNYGATGGAIGAGEGIGLKTSTGFAWGLGMNWSIAPRWSLRLEYEDYGRGAALGSLAQPFGGVDAADYSGADARVRSNMLSGSIGFRF